jgi:hypothetical protein
VKSTSKSPTRRRTRLDRISRDQTLHGYDMYRVFEETNQAPADAAITLDDRHQARVA